MVWIQRSTCIEGVLTDYIDSVVDCTYICITVSHLSEVICSECILYNWVVAYTATVPGPIAVCDMQWQPQPRERRRVPQNYEI